MKIPSIRTIRHFIVSWDAGKLIVSPAREVVPNAIYEILPPQSSSKLSPFLQVTMPVPSVAMKQVQEITSAPRCGLTELALPLK